MIHSGETQSWIWSWPQSREALAHKRRATFNPCHSRFAASEGRVLHDAGRDMDLGFCPLHCLRCLREIGRRQVVACRNQFVGARCFLSALGRKSTSLLEAVPNVSWCFLQRKNPPQTPISTEVEDPHFILFGCSRATRRAGNVTWEVLNRGSSKFADCKTLTGFTEIKCLVPGLHRSACAACPTWWAASSVHFRCWVLRARENVWYLICRPAVFVAFAELDAGFYEDRKKIKEGEQALAEKNITLYARVQGPGQKRLLSQKPTETTHA